MSMAGEGMPQALVAELDGISMTPALAATLARAVEYAAAQGHKHITLEHLLLALTEDEDAQFVFSACNVELAQVRNDVSGYLGQLGDRALVGGVVNPIATAELRRIVEYAAAAAQQGRRPHVDGAIVLAAMIGEGQSMAASFVKAQGLTFEEAVRVLQQQARPQAPPAGVPVNNGVAPKSAEEILATARERIEASRIQGSRPRPSSSRKPEPDAGAHLEKASSGGSHSPGESAEPNPEKVESTVDTPSLSDRLVLPGGRPMGVGSGGPQRSSSAEAPSRDWKPPPLPNVHGGDTAGRSAPAPVPRSAERADTEDSQPPPLPRWMIARARRPENEQPAAAPRQDGGDAGGLNAPQPPSKIQNESSGQLATALRRAAPEQPSAETVSARDLLRPSSAPAVEPGQLVENIPRTMRVGTPETVEVRIAREQASSAMTGLQGRGAPVRHELYITKAMSVRLRAPDGGFKIEAASPETQWTEATMGPLAGEFAVWHFLVTPERRGESALQLVVAARVVGGDGVMAETTLPERVITVNVRTNYVRTAARWSSWIAALAVGGAIGRLGEDAFATLLGLLHRWAGS